MEHFTGPVEGQCDGQERRRHSAARKFRIALEGSKTIDQLSSEYEIHPRRFNSRLPDCHIVRLQSAAAIGSGCDLLPQAFKRHVALSRAATRTDSGSP